MNTKDETVTLRLDGAQLVEALRNGGLDLPADARIEFRVPGGGDWSNRDIGIDADNPLLVTFSRPTVPLLEVRKLPTTEGLTHGGMKTYRRFKILVNGVEMETLSEGSDLLRYAEGQYFDDCVKSTIERYEAALRIEAKRTEGRS